MILRLVELNFGGQFLQAKRNNRQHKIRDAKSRSHNAVGSVAAQRLRRFVVVPNSAGPNGRAAM